MMERCNKIYAHPLYRKAAERIARCERDRIFCLHGLQHSLDTARIAYILALEEGLDIDKEIIYAAALLHDMGRYIGGAHDAESAELAGIILPECGFGDAETELIVNAVRHHRTGGDSLGLCRVLHKADGLSRSCFECAAVDECYWTDERRNNEIRY